MCIILKTERLIIRPISENDIENVFELQSLEQTSEFNTSKPPSNINETKINVDKWIDWTASHHIYNTLLYRESYEVHAVRTVT